MKCNFYRLGFPCLIISLLIISCEEELTYDRTLTGSWKKGGNDLVISADSTFYAFCAGYCWAKDGREDTYAIIKDSLITFDYDGIYKFKISGTGATLRFSIYTSLLTGRDDFIVGDWDRIE